MIIIKKARNKIYNWFTTAVMLGLKKTTKKKKHYIYVIAILFYSAKRMWSIFLIEQ